MSHLFISKKQFLVILLLLLCVTLSSAKRGSSKRSRSLPLTSVHLVDRNGFSETISHKDRLNQLQQIDFLKSQPYQKVLRIYARDSKGDLRSLVTSYHPNGNPKQFLEILNGRAFGKYFEWHENGTMSLSTYIIGGTADITAAAERTWIFHGKSYAWNEEGHLLAEIQYSQGDLEGYAIYYHPSGQIWKRIPYHKNQIEGVVEIYKETEELLQQITYVQGVKKGTSLRYWDGNQLASQEEYEQGLLNHGKFFDKKGELISEVKGGHGYRAIFGKESISELQEYQNGILEGEVRVFNGAGFLKRVYHIKNGIKHSEEIEYYDQILCDSPQQKLSFYWSEGKIQGLVRTWYRNGVMESQREMANNMKTGVATAWYSDGNLMLIEEYEKDKLIRGDYFKKGEKFPVSQVIDGKGVVTLFDANGHFSQKIQYANGEPEE
jgi:antitoxin component YwqK of YwqJK toxin-antitoxin module